MDRTDDKNKRYYFFKYPFDFMERPELKVLRKMDHGCEIIMLYLWMIAASANEYGYLRLNDTMAYTPDTLAAASDFSKEVCSLALNLLKQFGYIDVLDDGTIKIHNIEDFVGSETIWANYKRKEREKGQKRDKDGTMSGQNVTVVGQCPKGVQKVSKESPIDIDIYIDTEIDKEIDKEDEENNTEVLLDGARAYEQEERRIPSEEEVDQFIKEHCPNVYKCGNGFFRYYNRRGWTIKGEPIVDWRSLAARWEEELVKEINLCNEKEWEKVRQEYWDKFRKGIPSEYFRKVKYVQLAIATDTPLKEISGVK